MVTIDTAPQEVIALYRCGRPKLPITEAILVRVMALGQGQALKVTFDSTAEMRPCYHNLYQKFWHRRWHGFRVSRQGRCLAIWREA
jgi:hypothetical protein